MVDTDSGEKWRRREGEEGGERESEGGNEEMVDKRMRWMRVRWLCRKANGAKAVL